MARAWGYKLAEWRELPDADRDLLLAEDELVCQRCGNLRSVCSNPDLDWHPHTLTCWPSATAQWGQRRLEARAEKANRPDHALRDTDGVVVYASQVEPEDDPLA